jgi:hypothetical protein
VRSSNRASLSGRAEGRFSIELGTARLSRPGLTISEIARNLGRDGNIWVRPGYQTHPKKGYASVRSGRKKRQIGFIENLIRSTVEAHGRIGPTHLEPVRKSFSP